jgi:tetratricopeptide (TPR) repeat protein
MRVPDWRKLILNDGVLPERVQDDQRIVLWLPGTRDGDVQPWERISTMARGDVTVAQGLCAVAASSIQARQRFQGLFARFWQRFRGAPTDRSWLLPNGESAEQWGERQTDLLLVWAEDDTSPLEEQRLKARWPESKRVQQLGQNLFLVAGIVPQVARQEAGPSQPQGNPRDQAEQSLAAARKAGDRQGEAAALTDLGILANMRDGNPQRGVTLLEEAMAIARQLGDRSRESDVLGNLGLATLATGQAARALEQFSQELSSARAAGDRFAEKTALYHLGLAQAKLGDLLRALASFEQALALARALGDHEHEAVLLWYVSIQYAELGQREQAIAQAQAAVDLLKKTGKPQASSFADYLEWYRRGAVGAWPGGAPQPAPAATPEAFFGGSIVASAWSADPGPGPGSEHGASGPGLLRMAISAAKSMVAFVGSGFKTVPPEMHQKRIQTCAACEHHSGLRCKLCGCFTNAKAWMRHEDCPIGKWPA